MKDQCFNGSACIDVRGQLLMLIEIGGQIQELDIGGRIHDDNLTLEAEFTNDQCCDGSLCEKMENY